MSTSDSIRIEAQLISGIQIEPATSFRWIKEEIKNLVYQNPVIGKKVTEEVRPDKKGSEYTSEKPIVAIDRIIDKSYRKIVDYDLNGDTITFYTTGDYKVQYYTLPDEPKTFTEPLNIPEPYMIALKFYLASRIRARVFGQSDGEATSFYEEYLTAKSNADKYILKRNRSHRRIPPYRG